MNTRAFKRGQISGTSTRATLRAVEPPVQAEAAVAQEQASRGILVWDLPTRLFHWLLVAAVTVAIVTGELGGDWMAVHGKAGLAIVGLVSFRLVWGLVGSTHARFLSFIPTPGRVRSYLTGRWEGHGHNPVGALSVFALLAALGVQAGTGLFANDDIAFTGPLYALVEEAFALRLTGIHRLLANALLVLIGLHVVAIFAYLLLKKTNLIGPMVTGYKRAANENAREPARKGSWPALVLALGVALASVYAASGAFSPAPPAPAPVQQSATPAW